MIPNLLPTLLYSTLLHSTLLYSTPLYSTLLHSTPLYSTLLYSTGKEEVERAVRLEGYDALCEEDLALLVRRLRA